MGRMKVERKKCLNCDNRVSQNRNKCCSFKCSGEYKMTKFEKPCELCKKNFYVEPHRLLVNRGRFCSKECARKGIFTLETRLKMSLAKKGKPFPSKAGKNSHFWKGGITPENKAIRMSTKYRLWRESVFTRDNWTCVWCNQKGGRLQADHILAFSTHPELRFAIDNGRTLCIECHKKTSNYGRKALSEYEKL